MYELIAKLNRQAEKGKHMSGEVHRLKSWTDYRAKRPKNVPSMISEGFKTQPGYHTVMVILGSIDEREDVTEQWVRARMQNLGWRPTLEVVEEIAQRDKQDTKI